MWSLVLILLAVFVGMQVFVADIAVCVLKDTDNAAHESGSRTPDR